MSVPVVYSETAGVRGERREGDDLVRPVLSVFWMWRPGEDAGVKVVFNTCQSLDVSAANPASRFYAARYAAQASISALRRS